MGLYYFLRMSHYLPVDEIQKEIQSAIDDFLVSYEQLEHEKNILETDMTQALEQKRIEALKKKLNAV